MNKSEGIVKVEGTGEAPAQFQDFARVAASSKTSRGMVKLDRASRARASARRDIGGACMLVGEIRSQIHSVWEDVWSGGVSNQRRAFPGEL